jgi:succinyl-CoA synthetase beta subunit
MVSSEGGVEIEELAKKHPEKILKIHFSPVTGLSAFKAREAAFQLGLAPATALELARLFQGLSKAFLELDASLVEINPLVIKPDGKPHVLDAKVTIDDNSLYRHPDLEKLRDPLEEDAREAEAAKWGLSYVGLEGNIGCMVNGAGLAMGTMDIIKYFGGAPANFLDVGGSATKEKVEEAFKLILADTQVKAILVNIFGGIMRCDIIAQGIIDALKEIKMKVPLVVRLEGTKVEEGKALLKASGINLISASSLDEAAQKVVEASRK